MSARKPYAGSHRKLVVGIDVGTTLSGVSYCMLDPGVVLVIQGVNRCVGTSAWSCCFLPLAVPQRKKEAEVVPRYRQCYTTTETGRFVLQERNGRPLELGWNVTTVTLKNNPNSSMWPRTRPIPIRMLNSARQSVKPAI
jgi:hypothetical protein